MKKLKGYTPTITVIILNYNGRDLTTECVASVLHSTYPKYDIVIVDNCSTDDSCNFLKNKYCDYKKITVCKTSENRHFTGGFNFGAYKAKGEKIVLLSNDIVVEPNWLDELMIIARKDKKFLVQPKILQYFNRRRIDNAGGAYSIFGIGKAIGRDEIDNGQYNKQMKLDYASAACFMIDRMFFLQLNGYDESFISHCEDLDLCLRAKKFGAVCFLAWKSRIYHKISSTYKRFTASDKVIYVIRKNRVTTILKNYTGLEKAFRIISILTLHSILVLFEIIKGNLLLARLTIQATLNAFRAQKSYNILK